MTAHWCRSTAVAVSCDAELLPDKDASLITGIIEGLVRRSCSAPESYHIEAHLRPGEGCQAMDCSSRARRCVLSTARYHACVAKGEFLLW